LPLASFSRRSTRPMVAKLIRTVLSGKNRYTRQHSEAER
jgi:hypothetical protein